MVEPTQHGNGDHLVCLLRYRNRKYWQLRNPLPKPLMGSSLIEGHRIRFEKPGEVLLMEVQEVIQTFSSHTSQKTFTHGIRAARVRYGVRSTLMLLVAATRAKFGPYFRSLSPMRYVGVCPYGVASRSGTRHPGIGRGSCHIHMDPPSATVTRVLKNAKSRRKKRSVTCKKSQAPTPDTSAA
jgi:hypothetical protein